MLKSMVVWEGILKIPKGNNEGYGNFNDRSFHNAFSDSLKARLSLKDDSGKVKNEPREALWSTYEEAVAATESTDQFGSDFNCDMWLCVENPLNLDKSIICITSAKKDPKHWTVRLSSDRRTIGDSCSYVLQSNMGKAAFLASLMEEKFKNLSEIELDIGI